MIKINKILETFFNYLNHYLPTVLPFYLKFLIEADFLASLSILILNGYHKTITIFYNK